MTSDLDAFVIEHTDEPPRRLIVLHCRQGGFSFDIDEAAQISHMLFCSVLLARCPNYIVPLAEDPPPPKPSAPTPTRSLGQMLDNLL